MNKNNQEIHLDAIGETLEEYRRGKIIVVVDDEDRENEGDFIMAAEFATPDAINFMCKYGRGMICMPMTAERADELGLDLMVGTNTALHGTSFTVTIDAVKNTTTGISAADRATTILTAVDPATKPDDLAKPGHIFPLRAARGGVLKRAGHTEAVVDLGRLAGLKPAGVLCEIMSEDGSMARLPELSEIAKRFDLKLISIMDLIEYRQRTESLIERSVEVDLPTRYGHFRLINYRSLVDGKNQLALVKGEIKSEESILVRVHSECLTGDVFGSMRCDCGDQLHLAMERIAEEGTGVLLYMNQEGRGIGLENKLKAYQLQDEGRDTVEANEELGFKADLRDYGIGAQMLYDLGVRNIRLLTNNPRKVIGLKGYQLEIVERIPIEIPSNPCNSEYLKAKKEKLGHYIQDT
ncbi:bifunctional 3,4-dihydroxy-2-butanone-4-phosphate synthase/GTP cyclohydrolase II [candidate division LCP-89 bacterium B3_LCP]|uniref:Riboflavin biosynthesis protein RibBA n=1 Tax=candidate division LCP-89 bacterium B3_LCP TaxID=2012998 RepID=A0A532V376_UNCL8|nr:MAG: bifunctional 3,4-dihydroxy-2-butanone-4-phosphate synthase/GTP cyclohydrolase II [candidate division LCP-89 bacterium B3_LCP]